MQERRIGCGNSKLKLEADRRLNKLARKRQFPAEHNEHDSRSV